MYRFRPEEDLFKTIDLEEMLAEKLGEDRSAIRAKLRSLKSDIINELLAGNKVSWHGMFDIIPSIKDPSKFQTRLGDKPNKASNANKRISVKILPKFSFSQDIKVKSSNFNYFF